VVEAPADEALFTYGTLQFPEVQRDIFGRLLEGEEDVLAGYTVDYVEIEDLRVVEVSGADVHPVLRETGDARDKVVGMVVWLSADELDAADEYEVALYRRALVTLASGRAAWVYVAA
jgi:gamma-glutamylcyclotransferase (GGCT)/AIG2-like uncharacterized protein YtfP